MPELKDFLENLRKKHGTQVYVAGLLGIKSQLLGQYEKGKRNPKREFYKKWKQVFNQDIEAMIDEPNVSRESKNGTRDNIEPAISENALGASPSEIYKEMYEKFLGSNSDYLVIHREILKDHRIISVETLEKEKKQAENAQQEIAERIRQIDKLTDMNGKLADLIGAAASRPINIQLANPERAKEH